MSVITDVSQPLLISALLAEDASPHSAPNIDFRETHICWDLLTGEFACKIKKPV